MCVANLLEDQSDDHVIRIAEFSREAIAVASKTPVDEDDPEKGFVQLRVGKICFVVRVGLMLQFDCLELTSIFLVYSNL